MEGVLGSSGINGENALRGRTLLRVEEAIPLWRQGIAQTPAPVPERSNDEDELSSRRSLVEMRRRRLSSISQEEFPMNESFKLLGDQDIKHHVEYCAALFNENKISAKNAWELKIIDLLSYMAVRVGVKETLQMASTSLDISAKVYSVRVDDLHSNGLKLAHRLARIMVKENKQDGGAAKVHNFVDIDDGKAEKENVRTTRKKSLSQEEENLNIAKDARSLVGPLQKLESIYFTSRNNNNSSDVDNLWNNKLKLDNSGYKFMLLSKDKAWVDGPDSLVKNVNNPDRKKYPLHMKPVGSLKLCCPFEDFEVNHWNLEQEEDLLAGGRSVLSRREEEEEVVVFDDDGIPIPELDGSIHDIFANEPHDGSDSDENIPPRLRGTLEHIVQFRPDVPGGPQSSECSYNAVANTHPGKVVDQMWAGPSHWKLRCIKSASPKFSGRVAELRRKRSGRPQEQPHMVDFDAEPNDINMTKKVKKKSQKVDINRITLPDYDPSCDRIFSNIDELMSKPIVPPPRRPQTEYEVSAYNRTNPNNSQCCPQANVDEGRGNASSSPVHENHDDVEEEHNVAQQRFLRDNLVDAPEAVPQSSVSYALKSKKINMKKLKTAVWQILTGTTTEIVNDGQRSERVNPMNFSDMYERLPDRLTGNTREGLSCPLAFVALIHLANEQNLQLKQLPGYKDFHIQGPRDDV